MAICVLDDIAQKSGVGFGQIRRPISRLSGQVTSPKLLLFALCSTYFLLDV